MSRKRKSPVTIYDGLENVLAGIGGPMDKTVANQWRHSNRNQDHVALTARYRECWLSQKIVNIIPVDATREWRKIDSPEGIALDLEHQIEQKVCKAMQWARLYGTSFILLDVKGSGSMSSPLNLDRLRRGCLKSLQVVDRTRLTATGMINQDAMSPMFGQPEFYQFVGNTTPIHYSRVIRFEGTELPLYEMMRNQWYSDSVLIPMMPIIDNYHMASNAAANLCVEALVDVVSIEGLQNILANPEGSAIMRDRFRMMKQMKSTNNVLLLDSTEVYSTKTVALNGVKDLIWEYLRVVAAAAAIPATRFLATQPTGMNATGDADMTNYIDLLKGVQESTVTPRLKIIDRILQAHSGIAPWKFEWNCLFPESAAEKAAKDAVTIEALCRLVETGVLTPEAAIKILAEKHIFGEVDLGKPPALSPALALAAAKPKPSAPK